MKTPDGQSSWDFFDHLLNKFNIAGTPGSVLGRLAKAIFD
jgi:LL-diaminopimelate aminotransferase